MTEIAGGATPESPGGSSSPQGVNEFPGADWTRLSTDRPVPSDVRGQYMFYSDDRERLLATARDEIAAHGFPEARVSVRPSPHGYLLCLYGGDDSLKPELARRVTARGGGIRYLYWKPGTTVPAIGGPGPRVARRLSGGPWDQVRFGPGGPGEEADPDPGTH